MLVLRGLLRTLLAIYFYGIRHFKVCSSEKLPGKRQALILCCNHAALIDSIYIILAVKPRLTICGAKPRYFSTPFRRFLMRLANIIKVESRAGFLQDCGRLLQQAEIILIYPEMGRNPEGLGEFKTWAAEVALQNNVPILPCYLYGTTHGHSGPPRLIVGARIEPEGNAETLTTALRRRIVALSQLDSI